MGGQGQPAQRRARRLRAQQQRMAGTLPVLPKLCQHLVGGQVLGGLGRARQWQVKAQALPLAGQRGKWLGRQVGRQRAPGKGGRPGGPASLAQGRSALRGSIDSGLGRRTPHQGRQSLMVQAEISTT